MSLQKVEFGTGEIQPQMRRCDKHGTYEAKHIIGRVWSVCPVCLADSYAAEQRRLDEELQAERLSTWERRIGDAGIPERFRDRTLQSFIASTDKQQAALATCARYAAHFNEARKRGSCMIMCGKPGTGKTHLAIGIGLHAMDKFHAVVLFTTVMRAIRRVKETWNKGSGESETAAIAALVFPDLLILDEVGVQHGSETEKLILFDVLNERYEKRKPSILLSNKSTEELKAYLGERVYDRLREDGSEYVPFTWESYRDKKK